MKVYIQTDIEGIAGWCFYENRLNQTPEGFAHRERMRELLTGEVNAAVTACFDAGAESVIVNDNHGTGYNIKFEQLDERCLIVHGRNSSGSSWLPMLERCDVMICIGMHAGCGTLRAVSPHSLLQVNDGQFMLNECTCAAAIAGDLKIPVVLVSGDSQTIAQVRELLPEIVAITTKEGISPYMACAKMPGRVRKEIYNGVKTALCNYKEFRPFIVSGPVKVTLIDSDGHVPPFKEIGQPGLGKNYTEAFHDCERQMKWTSFNMQYPDGYIFP